MNVGQLVRILPSTGVVDEEYVGRIAVITGLGWFSARVEVGGTRIIVSQLELRPLSTLELLAREA